jgi:hypothetical protein
MMFRRFCERCYELVVCSRTDDSELTCSRCGGALVGPVAIPTPESYRDRVEILLSPHYTGAVATEPRRTR